MNILGCFPTPVYECLNFEHPTLKTQEVLDEGFRIYNDNKGLINPAWIENVPSTFKYDGTTFNILGNSPLFENYINYHISSYLKSVYVGEATFKSVISQSWMNVMKAGGYMHYHSHGHADISGVFYLQATDNIEDGGRLLLQSDSTGIQICKFNPYSSRPIDFTPKSGGLIMFPGWLPHAVTTYNNAEEERIAFAFNIQLNVE